MSNKVFLTEADVDHMVVGLHVALTEAARIIGPGYSTLRVFGIPRGGNEVVERLMRHSEKFPEGFVTIRNAFSAADADVFIDDLIDSGTTMQRCCDDYPGKPFYVLIDKTTQPEWADKWVVFPWESEHELGADDTIVGTLVNRLKQAGLPYFANDNISQVIHAQADLIHLENELASRAEHFLRGLVIDIDNDHNTKGTAKRIAKMYINEVFKGRYRPAPEVTSFPNAKKLDEMYISGPITIRSACSHHFVPIVGRCWIGVIPGDRVIGISKFNRLVDWIASRPQIQEELVMQIADHLQNEIDPIGLAVVVEATHMCMTWRGVKEPMEARMTNSVMRGAFRDKPEVRAEFLALVNKG